jgi:hypothetical protein
MHGHQRERGHHPPRQRATDSPVRMCDGRPRRSKVRTGGAGRPETVKFMYAKIICDGLF